MSESPADKAQAPEIAFDAFDKVDIRCGTVMTASKVEKSAKLLRLEVDLGVLGVRTIVSGIATSYMPESVVGMRVLVVANLAPRKMFGIESHGMLLAAPSASGECVLLAACPGAPNGARVG